MAHNPIFLLVIISLLTVSCLPAKREQNWGYPQIESQSKAISGFDTTFIDPYINLENIDNEIVSKWYKSQDSLAENYFQEDTLLSHFTARFKSLDIVQNGGMHSIKQSENGNFFYLKYDDHRQNDILYYKQGINTSEIPLFEAADYQTGDMEINYIEPSYDGSKVAIGFNPKENFTSRVIIIDVDSRRILPDTIENINPSFGGIRWLPDSSGFVYLYFPAPEKSSRNFKKGSFSVLHRLGQKSNRAHSIFSLPNSKDDSLLLYPKIQIGSSRDTYIIGYIADSGNFYDSYLTSITGLETGYSNWVPFFTKEDSIFWDQGIIRNGKFIYRKSTVDGNELNLVSLTDPDFKNPTKLAQGSANAPIIDFTVTENNIFYTCSKFGVEIDLYKLEEDEKPSLVELPFKPGYLDFLHSSQLTDSITIGINSWTSDYKRFIIGEKGNIIHEPLQELMEITDFDEIKSLLVQVPALDGEEIPMSLVFNKSLKKNEPRPVFIYVYGAYGDIMSPFYSPFFLDWVANGGILAFPHVRGGGEKGLAWHKRGMKSLKFNSWRDLNKCTEFLIEHGYTSNGKIALYTSSAGGITAGMAINEKPDLYGAFIAEVPRLNPFGLENSQYATSTSYLEYGSVKDSTEYYGLIAMDPYLNLKKSKYYPAVLLMPSFNDDRIPIWDTGKYIARLQKMNNNIYPLLLDVDYESGHEEDASYENYLRNYSKIFSFATRNVGTTNRP